MMEGPDGKWRFELIQEFRASLTGYNSIKAHKEGALVLTLYDGTQYIIEEGYVSIEGLMHGSLTCNVCDKITVKDITHGLTSVVQFDPDNQNGMLSNVASKFKFWGSKKTKRPSDHFDINIFEGEVEDLIVLHVSFKNINVEVVGWALGFV